MSLKGTVLVIDDEEVMREILESLLIDEGYSLRMARTAEVGLQVV